MIYEYKVSERIPALVSPVGVNTEIVQHGVNGFHCCTPEEWKAAILKCLNDTKLRKQLGRAGRKTVVERYSLESNRDNFLELFT